MGVRKTVIRKSYDYGICQSGLGAKDGRRMDKIPFSAHFAFSGSNCCFFPVPKWTSLTAPDDMLDCRHYKEGAWFSLETEPCTFFIFCAFFVVRAVSYLSD